MSDTLTRDEAKWSYSVGSRAVQGERSSRVRVYERGDLDGIFMTRAWIKSRSGRPKETKLPDGIDRERASLLADLTAAQIVASRQGVTPEDFISLYRDRHPEVASWLETFGAKTKAQKVKRDPDLGMVYIIETLEGPHRLKVGFAKDVQKRFSGIRTACPVEIRMVRCAPGFIGDERHIHKALSAHRVRGEWFDGEALEAALGLLMDIGQENP